MMKKYIFIIPFILGLFSFSCDQNVSEENFPYQEKLVIRGILNAGNSIKIYVGKTMPVGETYSEQFAEVNDAQVVLQYDDKTEYPRNDEKDGNYAISTIAEPGKKYKIFVTSGKLKAYAETTIPKINNPSRYYIKQVIINGENKNIVTADVLPINDEVYSALWVLYSLSGTVLDESKVFNEVKQKEANSSGEISVNSEPFPSNYSVGDIGVRLFCFDPAFFQYFATKGNTQISNSIFGKPGMDINWNIKGDGIGLFIGENSIYVKR